MIANHVQHLLEGALVEPAIVLAVIDVPGNWADAVKIQDDKRHPLEITRKEGISGRAVSSVHREGIQASLRESVGPDAESRPTNSQPTRRRRQQTMATRKFGSCI